MLNGLLRDFLTAVELGNKFGLHCDPRASIGSPSIEWFVPSYLSSARRFLWVLEIQDGFMFH